MKLNYKKIGEGRALVILHGLFGSLDNWQTLGKKFVEQYAVYLLDLRNHGHSPHSDDWTYDLMCDDLMEFLNDNNLDKIYLLGHSLGGKVAMQFALKYPERVDKLIVADIAPKYYPPHHEQVLAAMNACTTKETKNADAAATATTQDPQTGTFTSLDEKSAKVKELLEAYANNKNAMEIIRTQKIETPPKLQKFIEYSNK